MHLLIGIGVGYAEEIRVITYRSIPICHHRTMQALLYVPIVLSLAVLGAHFLRSGTDIGVAASLLLIGLLFIRQAWVARLVQVALVLGAVEWLRTLYMLAQWRGTLGEPVVRMSVILGFVAAVTFCSALLFQSKSLKRIYRLDGDK